MFKDLFRREPPETTFWNWFSANADAYRAFEINSPNQDRLFHQLDKALHRVHRGLQFAFDGGGGSEREFVISANGIRDLIPVVQKLVASAPELPGWKVVAFRPPMEELDGIELGLGDFVIGAKDLWYTLTPQGNRIGITLFLSGVADTTSESALMAAFLMLDSALGEFDVMTKVGTIEIFPMPPDPQAQGLKPYATLPVEFNALFTLMTQAR